MAGALRSVLARLGRIAALLSLGGVVFFGVAAGLSPMPPELLVAGTAGSVRIEDRGGRVLRDARADDGARSRWMPLTEMGETLPHAVLAAEDARFFYHPGVDPLAVVRAGLQTLFHGRVVSGASTLTMQLARTVRPHKRNAWGKVGEMALALRIELSLSKRRIFEEYMNRVSFGPNLRGVAAASQAYFGKSPQSLSVAEAALVAGMARGPSLYDLSKRPELARARRDRVIGRMVSGGWIAPDVAARAKEEPIVAAPPQSGFGAPHLVTGLLGGSLVAEQPGLGEALSALHTGVGQTSVARIRTTLDASVQRVAEVEVARVVHDLHQKGVSAASAIVIENETGDVLAYVGSPDFFDEENGGQNDGVRALRQPGSTLKPFLYELAMEKLGYDAATALPDVELHLDMGAVHDYAPRDYDGHVRGPVRLREALGNSLNIPAVWTAHELGVEALLDRLHELGFASLRESAEYYGPGLALGDGEVTLLELARAYATLARGGEEPALRLVSEVARVDGTVAPLPSPAARRVMPAILAALVTDILKDHNAREASFGERTVLDFPFDVAAKTGTSKGFRDNWTAGFTHELTVAVWVGNFAGEPMTNVSGISGAGPLFHAILEAAVARRGAPRDSARLAIDPSDHEGLVRVHVCALSGQLAGPDCPHAISEWREEGADTSVCSMHERIRIDRRNGLRAGSACGPDVAVSQVVEQFPPDLAAWALAAGRPTAPLDWSPACPDDSTSADQAEGAGADVRIVYPISGARFVIDPDTPRALQRVDVQIVAPRSSHETTLRVDGAEVARLRPPLRFSWPLAVGAHELVAESDGVRSAVVRVNVRD